MFTEPVLMNFKISSEESLAVAHVCHMLKYVEECTHSKSDLAEFTKQPSVQLIHSRPG